MISHFWVILVPLIFLGVQAVFEVSFSSNQLAVLMSESGPIEFLQWIIMVLACIVSAKILLRIKPHHNLWLFSWIFVALLACLYVAGEEISWGQHFLNWNTPAYWQDLNDQHETNLHNVSSWFDQKPRIILLAGIIVGGLIFPLLQHYRPGILPEQFSIIYPPGELAFIALLVVGLGIANNIARFFGIYLFERVSEVQEIYMFYFVLLYLIVLRCRILGK